MAVAFSEPEAAVAAAETAAAGGAGRGGPPPGLPELHASCARRAHHTQAGTRHANAGGRTIRARPSSTVRAPSGPPCTGRATKKVAAAAAH